MEFHEPGGQALLSPHIHDISAWDNCKVNLPGNQREPTDVLAEHRNCNDKLVSKAKKQFSGPAALAISTLRQRKAK